MCFFFLLFFLNLWFPCIPMNRNMKHRRHYRLIRRETPRSGYLIQLRFTINYIVPICCRFLLYSLLFLKFLFFFVSCSLATKPINSPTLSILKVSQNNTFTRYLQFVFNSEFVNRCYGVKLYLRFAI